MNQANKDASKVVKDQLHKALQIMSGKPAAPKATQKPSFLGNVLKAATRYYCTTTGSDNTLSTASTPEDKAAAALRAKTFIAPFQSPWPLPLPRTGHLVPVSCNGMY